MDEPFALSLSKGCPFPATVKVDGRVLGKAAIRKKGFFGSMDADRPSLKVKLDAAGQRLMGGLEKLTLNNNKQDRSLASQFLAWVLAAMQACLRISSQPSHRRFKEVQI